VLSLRQWSCELDAYFVIEKIGGAVRPELQRHSLRDCLATLSLWQWNCGEANVVALFKKETIKSKERLIPATASIAVR
jgi:hypothetical protein